MKLSVEELPGNVAKANLEGRLDIVGAQAIDLPFNVLVGSRRAIVVDLSKVSFGGRGTGAGLGRRRHARPHPARPRRGRGRRPGLSHA